MLRSPVFLIPTLVACGSGQTAERSPARIARWNVTPDPAVSIGVVEGAAEYELYEVNGSLRLTDGRIVVANAGSRELLYFDPRGRFLRKSGGKGSGPGEFKWLRRVYHGAADSVLALDWAADRVSVFDPAGSFAYSTTPDAVAARERPLDVWLLGPFLILPDPARTERATVQRTLLRLPRPDGPLPYRVVLPAPGGRLWLREAAGTITTGSRWTVVDSAAHPIAAVVLPPRFDLHEVGDEFVLGRWRDAQDVNYVRLYRLRATAGRAQGIATPGWLGDGVPWTADSAGDDAALRAIATALGTVIMAQERYYADHASYAEDAAGLALELPDVVVTDVLVADRRGHLAVAMHAAVPVVCGIAVGAATPVGWPEGAVTCGRPLPPPP
jgi:hypothetical protein